MALYQWLMQPLGRKHKLNQLRMLSVPCGGKSIKRKAVTEVGQFGVLHCGIIACVFISFTSQMLVNSQTIYQTIAVYARLFSYKGVLFY